ncbi:HD-GYP domain-containing protein, partial [Acetivibrio saccincola]
PHGIKGDEIPLEARILCVADAYDAMLSNRPYRKGMKKEEAIEELLAKSGTQFDPLIVDTFINILLNEKN